MSPEPQAVLQKETEERRIIFLPEDKREQFELKLEQYWQRVLRQNPTAHPELMLLLNPGTMYKIMIVERLLQDGSVDTHALSLEISREVKGLASNLDGSAWVNACAVIDDYCKTGGVNTTGITAGLPTLPTK